MGFFDFVVGDIHGIRVRELRQHAMEGGKVVATYCVFVPEELVWAADAIPVGLCAGTQFSVPIAEEVLPRNTCALIKSSFGFKLGRICPYVQTSHLIVGETTCDGKKKMFEILADHHPVYVMEVPNKKTQSSRDLWLGEVMAFKEVIERLTGNEITADKLSQATKKVNDRRRALKRLHGLRKANPVPISGKDALLVTQISFYGDVNRATQQINTLCDEVETLGWLPVRVSSPPMRHASSSQVPRWLFPTGSCIIFWRRPGRLLSVKSHASVPGSSVS